MRRTKRSKRYGRQVRIPGDWKPTPANINALPEPLRRYIHDVETNCDPAHLVQENWELRSQARAVEAMYLRLKAETDSA